MPTQVPLALFQSCVEQEGGMLPADCGDFHVLETTKGDSTPFTQRITGEANDQFSLLGFPKVRARTCRAADAG